MLRQLYSFVEWKIQRFIQHFLCCFSIELIFIVVLSEKLFKFCILSPHIYSIFFIISAVIVLNILNLFSNFLGGSLLVRYCPFILLLFPLLFGLLTLSFPFNCLQVLFLLLMIAILFTYPQHSLSNWLKSLINLRCLSWRRGLFGLILFDGHVSGLALTQETARTQC